MNTHSAMPLNKPLEDSRYRAGQGVLGSLGDSRVKAEEVGTKGSIEYDNSAHKPELRILGAGISGLLTGFWLKESGQPFVIIEREHRVGGLLGTHKLRGGLVEQAANGFIWSPALQYLCDRLGLKICAPRKEAGARYLVRDGRAQRMPLNFIEIFNFLYRFSVSGKRDFSSMADFGHHAMGKVALEQLLAPALSGIYGARPDELSFGALLPALQRQLDRQPWLPRAVWRWMRGDEANRRFYARFEDRGLEAEYKKRRIRGTCSFEGGMQTLLSELERHLSEHLVFGRDAASEPPPSPENPVVCCLPAYESLRCLRAWPGIPEALKTHLDSVRYLNMISCTVQLSTDSLKAFRPGFGCLIPETEGFNYLGVLFNSSIFPGRSPAADEHSFTGILRDDEGRWGNASEDSLATALVEDIQRLFGRGSKSKDVLKASAVYRWKQGIPLYSPGLHQGHSAMDALLREHVPGLQLFGNYTGQLSIRGMAAAAAESFFQR